MSYNGYANYETWAVGLFLDGNYDGESTYREVLYQTVLIAETGGDAIELADFLKDYVEMETQPESASLQSDLISAALSEVDWRELAEHKLSEVDDR